MRWSELRALLIGKAEWVMPVRSSISPRIRSLGKLALVLAVVTLLVSGALAVTIGRAPTPASTLAALLGEPADLDAAVREHLSEPSRVLAADGSVLGRFQPEERFVPISADEIPEPVVASVVAAEDESFFDHGGLDLRAILRAAVNNVRSGDAAQGGSTITQQLVKNLFTEGDRTL